MIDRTNRDPGGGFRGVVPPGQQSRAPDTMAVFAIGRAAGRSPGDMGAGAPMLEEASSPQETETW